LALPAAAVVAAVVVVAAAAVAVAEGVSVGDMAVVEGDHGQGSFQVVEGHQEDPACGVAGVGGDVRDRTLEDNRLDQDQAAWTLGVVLVQVRILLEAGSLVVGDRPDRVQALLGRAEGEDHGVDVAVMGQSVADLGEVRKLNRGRGARRGAVVHQGQARHWGWGLVQKVEGDSSRRL
jgi:hypothetical protein